jgi:hypothetical protein
MVSVFINEMSCMTSFLQGYIIICVSTASNILYLITNLKNLRFNDLKVLYNEN